MSQDLILKYINENQNVTPKELCSKLNLAKNTVSRQLNELRKKKLVIFEKYKHTSKIYINKEIIY